MSAVTVGVLALQGDSERHLRILPPLGVEARTVRRASELADVQALVIPGGESTTLARLLRINDLTGPFLDFARAHPVLGTCAGLILMATGLEDAAGVEPFGLLDVDVRRNGFGSQVDSFEELVTPLIDLGGDAPARGTFIRAPRILRVGPDVEPWAIHGQEPIAVRQGRHVGLTFHPELLDDARWHRAWLAGAGLLDA